MKFKDERFLKRLQKRNGKEEVGTQLEFDLKFFDQMAELNEKAEERKRSPKYISGEAFDDSDKLEEIG